MVKEIGILDGWGSNADLWIHKTVQSTPTAFSNVWWPM